MTHDDEGDQIVTAAQIGAIVASKVRAAVAALLVVLALGLVAAGLTIGFSGITAGVDAECGSAFSPKSEDETALSLSETGQDACILETDRRQTLATASLIAGAVVLVGAGAAASTVATATNIKMLAYRG